MTAVIYMTIVRACCVLHLLPRRIQWTRPEDEWTSGRIQWKSEVNLPLEQQHARLTQIGR